MGNKKEQKVTLEDLKDTTSRMFEMYEELLRLRYGNTDRKKGQTKWVEYGKE